MNSRPTKTLQKKIEKILNKKFKTVSFFDSTTRHTPSSLKNFLLDKFKNYNKEHCWQYEIRQQNLFNDLNIIFSENLKFLHIE